MKDKKFYIPQVETDAVTITEEEAEKATPSFRVEPFVSSVFGTKVKDDITFSGAQYGNKGRQYDAFRDKESRVVKDDYKDYITIKDTPEYTTVNPTPKPEPKTTPVRVEPVLTTKPS